jgi:hypothetical protein
MIRVSDFSRHFHRRANHLINVIAIGSIENYGDLIRWSSCVIDLPPHEQERIFSELESSIGSQLSGYLLIIPNCGTLSTRKRITRSVIHDRNRYGT